LQDKGTLNHLSYDSAFPLESQQKDFHYGELQQRNHDNQKKAPVLHSVLTALTQSYYTKRFLELDFLRLTSLIDILEG
jgi:hypothetical protein